MGRKNKSGLELGNDILWSAENSLRLIGKYSDNLKRRVNVAIPVAEKAYLQTIEGVMPRMVPYADAVEFARAVEGVSLLEDFGVRYWQGVLLKEEKESKMKTEGLRRGKFVKRVPMRDAVKRDLYDRVDAKFGSE